MVETRKVDSGDFADQISKVAGVRWKKLPMTMAYCWFSQIKTEKLPNGTATTIQGPPAVFQVGQGCPLERTFVIIAIFQNEDEVRVYCMATPDAAKKKGADENSLRPRRYTLCKISATYGAEQMIESTFISEVASELRALREDTMLPEDLKGNECDECETMNDSDAKFCKECGSELEEGEGGEEEEEEEEKDTDGKGEEPAPEPEPSTPAGESTGDTPAS